MLTYVARLLALTLIVVFALAALGGGDAGASANPVTRAEWKAVLNDWFAHGRFARRHSCTAAVVARSHTAPAFREGSALVLALDRFERSRCARNGDPWGVKRGMTDREVGTIAGAPVPWLSGPRCWLYRKDKPGTSIDGARYCFTRGRVTLVQIAVHG